MSSSFDPDCAPALSDSRDEWEFMEALESKTNKDNYENQVCFDGNLKFQWPGGAPRLASGSSCRRGFSPLGAATGRCLDCPLHNL